MKVGDLLRFANGVQGIVVDTHEDKSWEIKCASVFIFGDVDLKNPTLATVDNLRLTSEVISPGY